MNAMLRYEAVNKVSFPAALDYSAGDIIALLDGRVGVVNQDTDISTNPMVNVYTLGLFDVAKGAAVFAAGDPVIWDIANEQAVVAGLAQPSDEFLRIGIAAEAAATGDTTVRVALNQAPAAGRPMVFEFDCAEDTTEHELLAAAQNPTGLLIEQVLGVVTEVFAGASEDQGVVTIADTADNTITTITVADSGADAAGDVRLGYRLAGATAGDAAKVVAAGEGITGQVTTATSGSGAAGKVKVYITALPLV